MRHIYDAFGGYAHGKEGESTIMQLYASFSTFMCKDRASTAARIGYRDKTLQFKSSNLMRLTANTV